MFNTPGRSKVRWVQTTAGMPFPYNAVLGGRDIDGADIFVGRAQHKGDLLPAKLVPSRQTAYVCHGGREIETRHFEVLVGGPVSWQYATNGNVPRNAFSGGKTDKGELLYIGRVLHNGTQTVGKVHRSHHTCYIPYGGKEISYSEYEVLTVN